MANRLLSEGTDLDSIFQPYVYGDIPVTIPTNIQNGGIDICQKYAGRDNNDVNAPITVVNFRTGDAPGTQLNLLFNKLNATYNVTISGEVTYTSFPQTPILSSHIPDNTPVQATISSKTDVGNYSPSDFVITLPGNYLPGRYRGTFTILPAIFNVNIYQRLSTPDGYYISVRINNDGYNIAPDQAEFNTDQESFQITQNQTFGSGYYYYNSVYTYRATTYSTNPNFSDSTGTFSFPGGRGGGGDTFIDPQP